MGRRYGRVMHPCIPRFHRGEGASVPFVMTLEELFRDA